ncbi:MAG: adenylate/guanylate cyclase domain-containing protein [Bacteroidales bacterium]|nr:MAG: adenylate/guanylate cyclase domain-containing protein [Bacteroidales bacterium]
MNRINSKYRELIIDLLLTNLVWIIAFYLFNFIQLTNINNNQSVLSYPLLQKIEGFNMLISSITLGTLLGLINYYIQRNSGQLRSKSYGYIIITYSVVHLILVLVVISIVAILSVSIFSGSFDKENLRELFDFFLSKNLARILIFTYIVSIIIFLVKLINKKLGEGVLWNLILGKYRQPKEDCLLFLFMDLKSSTTYAELLGHRKYSELIQDCFSDLTPAVSACNAKIYQYIGDEAVLSWKYERGIKQADCIRVFFLFKSIIKQRSKYYLDKYGFVPEFKAGINGGKIMVAEVGHLKRSIAYHGDAINTAARIQGQCNNFKRDILLSEKVVKDILKTNQADFIELENIQLKGKKKKVKLFSINQFKI